ncbi:helix-turn-helix domain-containing protein [Kribbella sp. CA-294648]|uniref:helix-turn-helix domain-containing protein n=1 Tax=Kribbella sp. CA-294648 TaxID=3239948 RepID=UPI003D8BAE5F
MQDIKLLYRVPGVAEALGVSRAKVYQLIQSGTLKSVKIDSSRLIRSTDLMEFVADLDRAPDGQAQRRRDEAWQHMVLRHSGG